MVWKQCADFCMLIIEDSFLCRFVLSGEWMMFVDGDKSQWLSWEGVG